MTFEDWTDVMYETMVLYPLSWSYYLSFIFFTAFAFLNMLIGIVVNVLNEEHALIAEKNASHDEMDKLAILEKKIDHLTLLLTEKQK
jgi:voltage-gated sodium channel